MQPLRIVLAAVVGGVVLFAWGAASHMVLPLGHMGVSYLPAPVVPAMKASISERGFYFFPAMDESLPKKEAEQAWAEQYKAGPRGVLIYDPSGGAPMSPAQLGLEAGSNVLAALVLAIVFVRLRAGVLGRTLLGGLLGVFAWLVIDVSYWTWYRFPDAYTLAQLIDHAAGWTLGGLAVAVTLGRPREA